MDESALEDVFLWWQSAASCFGAEAALSALCLELARRSQTNAARFLTEQALDLTPGSFEALQWLEVLTPEARRHELCGRYEAFLDEAPDHPELKRVREALISVLFEDGAHEAALCHVDDALEDLMVPAARAVEPRRLPASTSAADHIWLDILEELDEVELEPLLEPHFVDAAE